VLDVRDDDADKPPVLVVEDGPDERLAVPGVDTVRAPRKIGPAQGRRTKMVRRVPLRRDVGGERLRPPRLGVRTRVLASALFASAALLSVVPSAGAGVLDQSQPVIRTNVSTGFSNFFLLAQTLTSGKTGALDQVDLSVARTVAFITVPMLVEIRAVSAGQPSGAPLGSASISAASVPVASFPSAFFSIPLSSPAHVTAGVQYAIVVSSGNCGFSNCYSYAPGPPGDPYPAGSGWFSANSGATWAPVNAFGSTDFAFKTYVLEAPTSKQQCKKGGWKAFRNPSFRNQGQCVAYVNHHNGKGKDDENQSKPKGHGKKK
jgi:hypothetical protein